MVKYTPSGQIHTKWSNTCQVVKYTPSGQIHTKWSKAARGTWASGVGAGRRTAARAASIPSSRAPTPPPLAPRPTPQVTLSYSKSYPMNLVLIRVISSLIRVISSLMRVISSLIRVISSLIRVISSLVRVISSLVRVISSPHAQAPLPPSPHLPSESGSTAKGVVTCHVPRHVPTPAPYRRLGP